MDAVKSLFFRSLAAGTLAGGSLLSGCEVATQSYVAPLSNSPTQSAPDCEPFSPPAIDPGSILIQIKQQVAQVFSPSTPRCRPEKAVLSFEGSIGEFGIQSIRSEPVRSVSVTNIGRQDATGIVADALAGPFSFRGGSYPGVGGTCGARIPARESCRMVVVFKPERIQHELSPLKLNYHDSEFVQAASTDLSGTGAAYPTLSFAEEPEHDFGARTVGTSVDRILTVRYAGMHPASGLTSSTLGQGFSYIGGTYPGTGGTCGTEISADCTLAVRFAPVSPGQASDVLRLNYSNGAFAAQVLLPIRGLGTRADTPASLVVTPVQGGSTDFGRRLLGSISTQQFRVSNQGTLPATLVSVKAFSNAAFTIDPASTCGQSIQSECLLSVNFVPTAEAVANSEIQLDYTSGLPGAEVRTASRLAITGSGAIAPVLAFSLGDPVDFGTQPIGFAVSRELRVSNTSATLPVTNLSFSGGFTIASNTCASVLSPGASCAMTLSFSPTDAGNFESSLVASYHDGFEARTARRQLVGRGTAAAKLVLSPASRDLGSVAVGASTSLEFKVSYFGRTPATGIRWTGLEGPAFFYDGGTCSTVIGADCTIRIKFVPQSAMSYAQAISLVYFDGEAAQSTSGQLAGRGQRPAVVTVDPVGPLAFGAIPVGASQLLSVRLSNTGEVATSALSLAGLAAPFSVQSSGCPQSLAAGASCTASLRFAPTTAGSFNGTLTFTYRDGVNPAMGSLDLTGTGSAAPQVGWGGGSGGMSGGTQITHDFGSLVVGAEREQSFPLQYYGIDPAQITHITLLDGPDYFYLQGSCSNQRVSANCEFGIRFRPQGSGTRSATFVLGYSNGTSETVLTLHLRGRGLAPAVLSVSNAASVFDPTPLQYLRELSLRVSNAATAETSARLTGLGTVASPFTILPGGCAALAASGGTLAPGASCNLQVTYQPTRVGVHAALLSISYNDGALVRSLGASVEGSGIEDALLVFSAGNADTFGNALLGSSLSRQIGIRYYGTRVASILSAAVDGPFSLDGAAPDSVCGGVISSSCSFVLRFRPEQLGQAYGVLRINYEDGAGHIKELSLSLSGNAIRPAALAFSQASVDLGSLRVGTSRSVSVSLGYSGDVAATQVQLLVAVSPFSMAPASLGGCAASVSGTCQIQLGFAPNAEGSFSQNVLVRYFDGVAMREAVLQLTGAASDYAELAISSSDGSSEIAKTRVGMSATQSLRVLNSGTRPASRIVIEAPDASSMIAVRSTTCGDSIAQGASCSVVLDFSPSRPGLRTGDLKVFYDVDSGARTRAVAVRSVSARGTVPVQIATRGDHTCAINELGQVNCWGRNNHGQTGGGQVHLGTSTRGGEAHAVGLGMGYFHSCAVLDDGRLKCWGRNESGQLGSGISQVRAVSGGYDHTCAIFDDQSVRCWGGNAMGQLGQGDTLPRATPSVVHLGAGRRAVAIAVNAGHSCALLDNGSLKCWGDNFYGQLGLGDFANRGIRAGQMGDALPAVNLGTGRTAVGVSVGGGMTCARLDDGSLKCFGLNYHGTLGTCWALDVNGIAGSCFDPLYRNWTRGYGLAQEQMGDFLPVVDLGSGSGSRVRQASSGSFFNCALLESGSIKCFGENAQGQLGNGDLEPRGDLPGQMGDALPSVALPAGARVRQLVSGNEHSCVVLEDESIRCWGSDAYGQVEVRL